MGITHLAQYTSVNYDITATALGRDHDNGTRETEGSGKYKRERYKRIQGRKVKRVIQEGERLGTTGWKTTEMSFRE